MSSIISSLPVFFSFSLSLAGMETAMVIRRQGGEGENPATDQDPGERNEGEDQPRQQQLAPTANVEPPPRRDHEDQSNLIPNMKWSAAFNLTSNLMDFLFAYLRGNLEGIQKPYLRAALTASVGVPIGVALSTFCFSYLVASNAPTWKKCITGLTTVNAGMIVGGPLSFNCLRN